MSDTGAMARALGLSVDGLRGQHDSLMAQGRALLGGLDAPTSGRVSGDDFDALALAATYRDAAVVALAYDTETARHDIAQAAEWYRRLARPVTGWYRSVSPPVADWFDTAGGTGGSDRMSAAHRAATVIDRMLASEAGETGETGAASERPGIRDPSPWRAAEDPAGAGQARRNPAQDGYALLTAGLLASNHPMLPDILHRTRATRQPLSAAPVGALGMPLRWYWKASMILALDVRPEPMLAHLMAAVRLQDSALQEARQDARVYARLMAPVDVIDLDIALLASAAALRWDIDETAWDQFLTERREGQDWYLLDHPGDEGPDDTPRGRPAHPEPGEGDEAPDAGFGDWVDPAPALGGVSVRAGLALGVRSPPEGQLGGPSA